MYLITIVTKIMTEMALTQFKKIKSLTHKAKENYKRNKSSEVNKILEAYGWNNSNKKLSDFLESSQDK